MARTITSEFKRQTGGRLLYASITLQASPADYFSLEFDVEPSELIFRNAIEDAIFAEILTNYSTPILGVAIRILKVVEDEIGSSYFTFQKATLEAMHQVFKRPAGQQNILWP